MIKILLSGCSGNMGQVITRLASESDKVKIVAGLDIRDPSVKSYPVFDSPDEVVVDFNVIIDFSNPAALDSVLSLASSRGAALVMATTGLSQIQRDRLTEASKETPIFFSANMSFGINLVIDLIKRATGLLEDSFDIEVLERHHNQKIDAPSGTAMAIADAINASAKVPKEYVYERQSKRERRSSDEIGIHSLRGGTIVGEHSIVFAGKDEIIEIKHSAMSKDVFGVGALKAAEFIFGKGPGLYSMEDLLA